MVLITMILILNFSIESGVESASTSRGLIKSILEVFLPEEKVTDELVHKFQTPIRKTAHICEFALLGYCFINAFRNTIRIKQIYSCACAFFSTFAFASFDEFIQGFSANRAPSFTDVLIDSFGGLIGILTFVLLMHIFNKKTAKKIRD